jgi:alkyl hydroperoxide reductase subunit D
MKDFINNFNFDVYNKDTKLNLSSLLMNNNKVIDSKLVAATIYGILFSKNHPMSDKFLESASEYFNDDLIEGVRGAATIMNMNNVYYRGKHILGEDYSKINPALRMQFYMNHKIEKKYFEFVSLSVSFVNNCEFCIKSHSSLLEKEGMTKEQIHESLRIAAIINSL